jgi:hypothetical protein
MLVFQDVFNNDEVMSDVFPFTLDYEDVIMKVKSSYKNKEAVGNVDIGCGNAFGGSEEEAGGEEAGAEKVIDVVHNANLVQTNLSKADFMAHIKGYVKRLKAFVDENKPDRSASFQKGASEFVKFVVSKFDEFEFYTGSKEDLDEGSLIFSFWEDESAPGPVFYFWKDALKEVKC